MATEAAGLVDVEPVRGRVTVACLGWGSLIWKPSGLPILGAWQPDGPSLPLEFSRLSSGGRVTLVLRKDGQPTDVLWCRLECGSLKEAIGALAARERTKDLEKIGRWPGNRLFRKRAVIAQWAQAKGLSGVVWTALEPKWTKGARRAPTLQEIFTHLDGLDPKSRADAIEYILNAPAQVETPFRRRLEEYARMLRDRPEPAPS